MEELIKKIEKIVKEVYDAIGSGHSETIYENAVKVGLMLDGIHYDNQRTINLTYKGYYIGDGQPDLIVSNGEESLIIELKAVATKIGVKEEAQLRAYMRATGITNGLLINMQSPSSKADKESSVEITHLTL